MIIFHPRATYLLFEVLTYADNADRVVPSARSEVEAWRMQASSSKD